MKNTFIVELAVKLGFELLKSKAPALFSKFFFSGPIGFILQYFAKRYLGFLVSEGLLVIDFGLISARVAIEKQQFTEFAERAYKKAKAKRYTEAEKDAIRKEYLKALRDFGVID